MPMRRTSFLLLIIVLFCLAVSSTRTEAVLTPLPTAVLLSASFTPLPTAILPSPSFTPLPTTALPSATFTPLPTLTSTYTPTPSLTLTPLASPTAVVTLGTPGVLQPLQATVLVHPDGGLYVGDQVSFEVIVPTQSETRGAASQVMVNGPDGQRLGSAGFGAYGLGERQEAMLVWAWDTRNLDSGDYPITFTLQPGGQVWTETLTLLPQESLPWPEPQAHWATARSKCCTLYYLTDTASDRDMNDLLRQADAQASDAAQRMGIDFTAPITITLLSRVLGQGGFAGQEIDITYLDRNYVGSDFGMVLHHEMIHILDARLGGDYRPSLFVEGLAVYETGGHFKPEPLMPRAAALLPGETGLGWYIPLAELADHFYTSQHEIGYLEGAALVNYMVDTWGWEAFSSFYRDIHATQDNNQASAIDAALQKHFQLTFSELEAKFKAALSRIPVTTEQREDLRLTVKYYDTARRYQQILDPSAFFQAAWLVDTRTMRSRAIVADILRHPAKAENLALEAMLVNVFSDLSNGQYAQVEQMLGAINATLDAMQRGDYQPFEVNDMASDFYAIVQAVGQAGYQVQRIELGNDSANAWATADSTELVELTLKRGGAGWEIATP
jgi:hypothetical protein